MDVVTSPEGLTEHLVRYDQAGASIAFVPTMGNLHEGHLALVRRALERADVAVASVFVNPMQFGPNEDLDAYPRTLAEDIAKLEAEGAQLLFTPSTEDIYPEGVPAHTSVSVPGLTDVLCGASRPGHFDGVTTVVCKLLNLVGPDIAVFGEKDLQQLTIIRKMVRDLALPVAIEGVATARSEDGLALSSRNGYLSDQERLIAPRLYAVLTDMGRQIGAGHSDYAALCETGLTELRGAGFAPDYLEIRRRLDLKTAAPGDREIAVFAAARLGTTRLIDNLQIDITDPDHQET